MTDKINQGSSPSDIQTFPFASAHILTDIQIRQAVQEIHLITGKYEPDSARYASYELHASDYAEKLVYDNEVTGHVEMPTHDNEIVVEPGTTIKLYTAESINLPANMLALVMALGQLFAAGLAAGSTYVDPGSQGEIYISLTNLTQKDIRIPVGCPIARAMFFVLGSPVETRHGGLNTRRQMKLRVSTPVTVERNPQTKFVQPNLSARFAWHKLGIYVVLGLFVGLAWATVAKQAGNSFINVVIGDSLPKPVRLIVPPLILACLAFAARDVRTTVREVLISIARRFANWMKDLAQ